MSRALDKPFSSDGVMLAWMPIWGAPLATDRLSVAGLMSEPSHASRKAVDPVGELLGVAFAALD